MVVRSESRPSFMGLLTLERTTFRQHNVLPYSGVENGVEMVLVHPSIGDATN